MVASLSYLSLYNAFIYPLFAGKNHNAFAILPFFKTYLIGLMNSDIYAYAQIPAFKRYSSSIYPNPFSPHTAPQELRILIVFLLPLNTDRIPTTLCAQSCFVNVMSGFDHPSLEPKNANEI